MRSILTLIGIVIGVASAAFLAAQSTNASVEGSIDTLFNVYNSDAWVWFEEPIRADFTARLRAIPGVEDVERWSTVHGHLQHTRALFYGLSADTQMYRHEVVEGRWFAPGVWDEVVLTTGLAEEAGVRPGDQVTMDIWGRQRTFRVVGLAVDNITTGLGAAPIDKAFAPAETVSRLMGRQGWADFFALRTTDRSPAGVEAVLTRLEDKYGDLRLRAAATYADMEYARDVSRILTVALWAMVLIVALSGGIGVLNTLALNVMERRREIGVLRAIGAVDWSMVQVFLTEGLILGLLGAGVGLLLAYPLARYFVDTIAENMGFPIATLFTGRTAVTGVLFALVLGRRWPAWARPRARRGCVCARRCGMSERPSLLSELDRAVPKKNRTQWMRRYMMNQYRLCSPLALVLGAGTLAVLPILGFTAGSPPVAQAQNVPAHMAAITITVDTTTDSNDPAYQACTAAPNDCCLRGAISKANADSNGTYIITLPAGLYGLTLSGDEDDNAAGDLDIRRSLTILGTGAGGTIISGNQIDRVLHIQSTVAVEISSLRITGGKARIGSHGGGIYNAGTLTLSGSTIDINAAGEGTDGTDGSSGGDGGNGGGIYNVGTLVLNSSLVSGNATGHGGRGGDGSPGGRGGNGGSGGGIYSNGPLTLDSSTVGSNATGYGGAGDGGNPYSDAGDGGDGGAGGGIYSSGPLTLHSSVVSDNATGGGGCPGAADVRGLSGASGNGGPGGGIYNGGTLLFNSGAVSGNHTGPGGGDGNSSGGDGGNGGGIYNSGTLTSNHSFVSGNRTGYGWDGGTGGNFGGNFGLAGGSGGAGGGICNTGMLTLHSGTVSGNNTGYGGDGGYGRPWAGGSGGPGGPGGGIYNSGTLSSDNSVVSGNNTGRGGRGGDRWYGWEAAGSGGGGGPGGGIYNSGILASNSGVVRGNATGYGGNGGDGFEGTPGGGGGDGGYSGGIHNSGTLTSGNSVVSDNVTGAGGNGGNSQDGAGAGHGGDGGHGGGIFDDHQFTHGSTFITFGTVSGNITGNGGSDGSIISGTVQAPAAAAVDGVHHNGLLSPSSVVASNTTSKGGNGGGLLCISGTLTLNSSVVISNTTNDSGDGSGVCGYGGTIVLTNAVVADNMANPGGYGGVYLRRSSARLMHTTIAHNTGGDGSGVYVGRNGTTAMLINTILVSHTVGISVTGGNTVTVNGVLWHDTSITVAQATTATVTVQNQHWGDPAFMDPAAGDYHIGPTSAALDAGVDAGAHSDIDGEPRPYQLPDLGADEYWPPGALKRLYLPLAFRG